MTKNEAPCRLDVERLAREEIDVRGAIVGKRVTARVTLRQQYDPGDGEGALYPLLGDGRRPHGREGEFQRQLDKCLANPGAIEPSRIASERVGNPVESKHGLRM